MIDYHQLRDKELIEKCLEQDAESWEALVRRYQRLIISVAMNCGLNAEDALDVLQTVNMILLQKLQTLREQEKLSAWLITITKRESWQWKKQAGANDLLEEEEWNRIVDKTEALSPEPDQAIYRVERQHFIRQAEKLLSLQCRKVLALLFSENEPLSYAEISRQLDIPVSSIGPTRARCLSKMKDILHQLGFFSS